MWHLGVELKLRGEQCDGKERQEFQFQNTAVDLFDCFRCLGEAVYISTCVFYVCKFI